ncbi:membrane protein [Lachnospiraceae bacterium TWA4]|nr:membrane protein [Lachnospiraceae bacterium TWA4]
MISYYFVEFIFYSFLGWIWETIYCTSKKKKWENRGFLFGPICPIYGSCVVLLDLLATKIFKQLSSPSFPIIGIFLICMIGSAIVEFTTSWYLEKRFHAVWWDYSHLPFNIQGRICPQVSIGFGLAGILVLRYLIPTVTMVASHIPVAINEVFGLLFAAALGADMALTEASLSKLLKNIEEYKKEFDEKAEATVENIVARTEKMKELSDSYIEQMSGLQLRSLRNIQKFKPKGEMKFPELLPMESLKNALVRNRKKKKEK